jgi:hypothetical protein
MGVSISYGESAIPGTLFDRGIKRDRYTTIYDLPNKLTTRKYLLTKQTGDSLQYSREESIREMLLFKCRLPSRFSYLTDTLTLPTQAVKVKQPLYL